MSQPQRVKIFFCAGEPSGDMHGANLIRALRDRCDTLHAVGYGGPNMAKAGCSLHADLTALAIMWFVRAILNVHKFAWLLYQADRYFKHQRPDAVVLIDFPGFNWWIARRAKKYGIPVFYFSPPQVWAWACWRVKKMRRFVDHVLCSLPFEQQWLAERGCNAVLVGHPYFDELEDQPLDQAFLDELRCDGRPYVTLLPGSRTQEVALNLRWFLKSAALIQGAVPEVRFGLAAFKQEHADMAEPLVRESGLPIDIYVDKTPELIQRADCCLSVSGSVSLELLHHTKPTVVHYWVSLMPYLGQRLGRRVRYITLVNLLSADDALTPDTTPYYASQPDADQVLFPEYLTCVDKSTEMASHIIEWLTDDEKMARRVAQLQQLKEQVCHGGASATAATYVLDALGLPSHLSPPGPRLGPGEPITNVPHIPLQRADRSQDRAA